METCQSRDPACTAHSARFFRAASSSLVIRACDEGALVFDEKSGTTSLLNSPAVQLLHLLSSASGLAESDLRLALGMNEASDAEPFQALLDSLAGSGLIVPC